MVWIIVIGILLFFGLKYPVFGKSTLLIIAVLVLGVILLIVISTYSGEQRLAASKSLIPLNQVTITNLRLSRGYAYQLSGEVRNNSNHTLLDITLAVKAYDCPGYTISSDCTTIGEDDNVSAYVDIPPNQVRALNSATYVQLNNMPPVQGNFLWTYDLTGTMGQ